MLKILKIKIRESWGCLLLFYLSLVLFSLLREIITHKEESYVVAFNCSILINSIIGGGYTLLLLGLPTVLAKRKLKLIIILIGFIPFLSNLFNYIHIFQYKTPITMGAFAVIFETTPGEAFEFFNLLKLKHFLISLSLSILPLIILLFLPSKKSNSTKNSIRVIATIFLFSVAVASVKSIISNNHWSYKSLSFEYSFIYNDAKRIAYYFREKQKLKDIQNRRKNLTIETSQKVGIDTTAHTVVLILGESLAKNHMSLYGYYRKTTPFLDSLSSLYRFNDVVASATQTRTAMMMMLTPATTRNLNLYYNSESLINVVNNAGYTSWWISNQMMFGISDTETSVIAKDAHHNAFINTDWTTASMDEKLIEPLRSALKYESTKKFIILHMIGNHHDYHKRYPNREPFILNDSLINPGHWDNRMIDIVKHYDNSVRYTDFVLSEVIDLLKQQPEATSVIFLSDHGQEVYDRPGVGMGHGSPRLVNEAVEVPFFVWTSDNRLWATKTKSEFIDRPFSLENLFHAVIDFLDIETASLNNSMSLFHSDFIPTERYILNSAGETIHYEKVN